MFESEEQGSNRMIEEHFNDIAVLNHTQKCAVKIFGKKLSLGYKIVK